jgi:hypothetical protein
MVRHRGWRNKGTVVPEKMQPRTSRSRPPTATHRRRVPSWGRAQRAPRTGSRQGCCGRLASLASARGKAALDASDGREGGFFAAVLSRPAAPPAWHRTTPRKAAEGPALRHSRGGRSWERSDMRPGERSDVRRGWRCCCGGQGRRLERSDNRRGWRCCCGGQGRRLERSDNRRGSALGSALRLAAPRSSI